jgi:3alpha(or 20beta)-hydroxysteroid dehydrogenase
MSDAAVGAARSDCHLSRLARHCRVVGGIDPGRWKPASCRTSSKLVPSRPIRPMRISFRLTQVEQRSQHLRIDGGTSLRRFDGKVALVTGASRGMGATEARRLAAEGAAVVICDILETRGELAAADIRTAGGDALYRHLDVTSEIEWQETVTAATAWRGRIDILVNNAGINVRMGVADLPIDDWNRVLAVNLTGSLVGMRNVAPIMRSNGGGSIVNIASVAGLRASRSAAYSASKWGLRGLSRVAALEYAAWGIRVNTVCPGVVPTELNAGQPYLKLAAGRTPMRRLASAEDVGRAVLFLASDDAAFITGTDIVVDGGITALDPGSAVLEDGS